MFIEKLNRKISGIYTLEEEKIITDGVWEGCLDHDNVNHDTLVIYTESKLAGDKVENFFISTPSQSPWKTHLKIFSATPSVFVVYESKGDQVDAEDINTLQNFISSEIERSKDIDIRLTENINTYKAQNNTEVNLLKGRASALEVKKADKTYTDVEFNKRYLKEQVFTKDEVLSKIQNVIGSAPEALDTLVEIASALNNDANFAGTMTNELSKKVDKVLGKSLSDENYTLVEKNKLMGIEEGANKYIHPAGTNPHNTTKTDIGLSNVDNLKQASQVEFNTHNTDATRHIRELERTAWNSKAEGTHFHSEYVTQSDLGTAGYGDMLKSIYDTNNSGKIDIAEVADSVAWSGITDKPLSFPPITHTHEEINTEKINNTSSKLITDSKEAYPLGYSIFKNWHTWGMSVVGMESTVSIVETMRDDNIAIQRVTLQLNTNMLIGTFVRSSYSKNDWTSWAKLWTKGVALTCDDIRGL